MGQTLDERLALEKDSFFKTALIAYVANFWTHNHQIDPEQIVKKSAQIVELTWAELADFREREQKCSKQSEQNTGPKTEEKEMGEEE